LQHYAALMVAALNVALVYTFKLGKRNFNNSDVLGSQLLASVQVRGGDHNVDAIDAPPWIRFDVRTRRIYLKEPSPRADSSYRCQDSDADKLRLHGRDCSRASTRSWLSSIAAFKDIGRSLKGLHPSQIPFPQNMTWHSPVFGSGMRMPLTQRPVALFSASIGALIAA